MDAIRAAAEKAKEASYRLQNLPLELRNEALKEMIKQLIERKPEIVSANQMDLKEAKSAGLSSPLLKRLSYDGSKIQESVQQLQSLIAQEDPIGRVISRIELDQGLMLERVSCPIGVIGVVFESRPDALVQISSLCIKSGNTVLLKGGSEAKNTNEALARAIDHAVMKVDSRFKGAVQLLSTREEFRGLLALDGLVDLIIPRGSNELVRSIQASTKIPVLGHAAGVCHTYVHKDADVSMAVKVCFDAKCQYPAVCNAMETLLVHKDIARALLPKLAKEYQKAGVELRGDSATGKIIKVDPATEKDWWTEYNDLVLAIKVIGSLDEAIDHINKFGSHHTDAIITADPIAANRFMELVDSSSVMWNCSTRFADGYRYGLGAEVGISTSKTHARGPVGLEGLTIYKYRLSGNGQIVADYVGKNARKFTHRKLK
jgi:glutamate-5-semialdehyde dehydrogenase